MSVIAAIVIAGLVFFLVPTLFRTRLTFTFEDAVSKSWVWDATATLQGREIRSYYQSSTGAVPMTFTHLKPGRATLVIKAPNYVSEKIPVNLHLGENVIPKPIAMVGYRIPGLTSFTMFETQEKSGLSVQMRPVDAAGHVITTLPCLNLWVGVIVRSELKGGRLAVGPIDSGAARGAVLYRGKIRWSWDSSPSQNFRYTATIPYSKLSSQTVPYLVVDYLVIVPDPRRISSTQIDAMMSNAPSLDSPQAVREFLDAKKGDNRFKYFYSTSWNVPGPGKQG